MDEYAFNALLPIKVADMIGRIMAERGLGFTDAMDLVYRSELYRQLQREPTKVWHYSPLQLIDMLDHERHTGQLAFPDQV